MMKGGLGNLMKQAQRMQQELQQAQEKLADEEVDAEAGGGLVRVTMNGRHEVRRIQIDDSLLQDDKEMLEDLVAAAVNAAVQKVASVQEERLSGLTAGMGLPAGMKLPF
ncbi:MAG: YbaB/EbfC family nucleoid-associated protein [Gammaproteobacteria bacterium SHHR-1]|uniref:YbaB/EbfC family nucleoid-associated protein n=1 Tax=Magnetovirga frankeli TaxID=947516 RepID=UPI00129396FC|nr:YbaB/EbfC family nucleoid-associated protein [gamma proteobacterium SS-5]